MNQKRMVLEKWVLLGSRENTTTMENLIILSPSAPTKDGIKISDAAEMAMAAASATYSKETATTVVSKVTSRMIDGRRNKTRTFSQRTGNLQVSRRLQPLMEVAELKLFSWQQVV